MITTFAGLVMFGYALLAFVLLFVGAFTYFYVEDEIRRRRHRRWLNERADHRAYMRARRFERP